MNTDLDYIVIDQDEVAPSSARIVSYARRHSTLTAALGLALVSIIALTSCYALKARSVDSIPRPKKDIKFQLDEKRPWLRDTPSATGKRWSSSGLQGKRFHLSSVPRLSVLTKQRLLPRNGNRPTL